MSTSSLSERSSLESIRSAASSVLSTPDVLPRSITGSIAWGEAVELHPNVYVLGLDRLEIDSIRAAVVGFKLRGLPRSEIAKETFVLPPRLAQKLSAISDSLHLGRGFAVVRGLDTARFNDEEAVIAFAGVSTYVCPQRATDSYANQTLNHVRDATREVVPLWAKDIGLAGSKITSAMDFHCDRFSGDILALHVRNDGGADGGEQFLSSFWQIYNELLKTEPAVLETLMASNWPWELKSKDADAAPYLEYGPALLFSQGKPICQIVKAPLIGSPRIPRSESMPSISNEQMHALQRVEDLAKQFCIQLDRRNGDIQFINNLGIMHARSAYGKKTTQGPSSRHLLRMFLRDPANAWTKPARYREKFDDPFTPGREQNLPVVDSDPWRKISGRESHG